MRTVLVTGGCGFIGSHFVRLLLQRPDYQVVNLDKLTYAGDPSRLAGVEAGGRYLHIRGDIAEADLVETLCTDHRPWAVVNFAAESHVDRSILDPAPFLRTNVQGVQALLAAARRHGAARFLQISTDEVYGDATGRAPFSEDHALRPSSPYAASKAAADLLCLSYQRTYGVPILVARSSNNYGPFQFPEKLIPLMIVNALAGRELPLYGDGSQRRDWLYVEDNCDAILRILERGAPGNIYNIGTGQERANLHVVEMLCDVIARRRGLDPGTLRGKIRFVADRPGHDARYALDIRRMQADLGWSPTTPFEAGLERTVAWYLEHADWVTRTTDAEYRQYYEAVYRRNWDRAP